MSQLNVTVSPSFNDATTTVFRLQGFLDSATVSSLERLYRMEPAASHSRWIMDLSQIEYISSAGFGSFVSVLSDLRSRGGDLLFVGVPQKVDRIFRVLGFYMIFKVFKSEGEITGAPLMQGGYDGEI